MGKPKKTNREVQYFPRYLADQIHFCALSEVDLNDGLRIFTKLV